MAMASIGALYIAIAELSDYRRVQLNIRFAPPAPEIETTKIQKLGLVIENRGRKSVKDIEVYAVPPICFGYTSNPVHSVNLPRLNVNSEQYFHCYDCFDNILNHPYTFTIVWKNWIGVKKIMTKEIYWDMYRSLYPALPEITPEPISEEEQIERILNS